MEALLAFVIFGLAIAFNSVLFKQKSSKQAIKYLNRSLLRLKHYRSRLPFLDGYITMFRLRKHGIGYIDEIAKLMGPTFLVPFADRDVIFLSDVNMVKKILSSTEPGHLNKPKLYDLILSDPFKVGLFAVDYEIWSRHRKAIFPATTYKGFSTYLTFMNKGGQNLVKRATDLASQGGTQSVNNVDMKKLIDLCTVRIITEILMGSQECELEDRERVKFHENFHKYKTLGMDRYIYLYQFIPIVFFFTPTKWIMDRCMDDMNRFSNKIVNNYRAKAAAQQANSKDNKTEEKIKETDELQELGVKPFQCMIEELIQAGLPNQEIIDEINTLLAAGHETITAALDMLIVHLANNPNCQEKCFEEIAQMLGNKHDDINKVISMDDLTQLKYLERCVLEGLRITPTVPCYLRRLDKQLVVQDDLVIEAGQDLILPAWVIQRNPEIYPNPEKFDPDRFLPENVKERPYHAYLPFSLGARNCVGWKLAILEMKMTMAWILRYFKISSTDKLEDVKLLFDITLKPERLYNVTFTKRQ